MSVFEDFFRAHGIDFCILGLGFGLLKWLMRREIDHFDNAKSDHESRIRKLEETRVTHDDFDELRSSLMASMHLVHSDITQTMSAIQSDMRVLTAHLLKGSNERS